jgi:hypothetical protein
MRTNSSDRIYPIHPRLKDEELLSSWIARLSLGNGLTPSKLGVILLPNSESIYSWQNVDLMFSDMVLAELSKKTATPLTKLYEASLRRYDGLLYSSMRDNPMQDTSYGWIMPHRMHFAQKVKRFGLQACPQCLASDDKPYFRCSWRLAFVIGCPKHKTSLIDRCLRCGEPIQFLLNASSTARAAIGCMTICHKCGFDLRNATSATHIAPELIGFQEHLSDVLRLGYIEVEGLGNIEAYNYFRALHRNLKFIINTPEFKREIQNTSFEHYGFKFTAKASKTFRTAPPERYTLERCDMHLRHKMMTALYHRLINVPAIQYLGMCLSENPFLYFVSFTQDIL